MDEELFEVAEVVEGTSNCLPISLKGYILVVLPKELAKIDSIWP
jgi:hypothetical protein